MGKPKIIVTGPSSGGATAWYFTALNIYLAGGIPYRAHPENHSELLSFDGLILGGGTDVDPSRYESTPAKKVDEINVQLFKKLKYPVEVFSEYFSKMKNYDRPRDDMEFDYLEAAINNKRPVLGICRGHQLVNIFYKGKLCQSTKTYYLGEPRIRSLLPRKKIQLAQNSQIIEVIGHTPCKVNALHNQAVEIPGNSLKAVAKEFSNGMIQATESEDSLRPIITVQWHPEYLVYMKSQRKLFSWLIARAKEQL